MRTVPVFVVLRETNTAATAQYTSFPVSSPHPQCLGYIHRLTPTYLVILALFVTIFAALVTRSVRRRRQRNAAFVAALASGTYGPSGAHRSNRDGVPEKPVLWESLVTSVYDEAKGWAGLSVRHFPDRIYSLRIIRMLRASPAMVSL